jgi:AcrR family transcriptional regulator
VGPLCLPGLVSECILKNMARPSVYEDDVLLESLRASFLELGPAAPSQELARRAGVSEGTLFKRFGTKRRLFALAMRIPPVEDQVWFQGIGQLAGKGTVREQLTTLARGFMTFMSEVMPMMETLLVGGKFKPADLRSLLGGQDDAPPLLVQSACAAYFEKEIQLGRIRPVHAGTLVDLLLGACVKHVHGREHFGDLMGDETLESAAARFAGVLADLAAMDAQATPAARATGGKAASAARRKS